MNPQNDISNIDNKEESERGSKNDEEKKRLISKHSSENIYEKEVPIKNDDPILDNNIEKLKYTGPNKNIPLDNDELKVCFGCFERLKYYVKSKITCLKFNKSYTSAFKVSPFSLHDEMKDRMLEIKIHQTGPLMPEHDLVHPFIKMHFIDTQTSQYVQKSQPDANIMPFPENVASIKSTDDKGTTIEMKDVEQSFVLPLSTRPCDLRIAGESRGKYDEAFIIKELVSDIIKPSTVILFELLDYGHNLVINSKSRLNKSNLLPIAWGYIRILGEANIHLRKHKIQLYYYKFHTNADINKKIDLRTPEVFFDFNWPIHVLA